MTRAPCLGENTPVNPVLLTLPVFVPVLFWAAYHYHKDRHLPEPAGNLLLCFVLGIAASYLSQGLYVALGWVNLRYDAFALAENNPLGLLAFAVLAIGPIEEFAKLIPFVVVALRLKAFDEPMDGIIYASFIALGYATMENLQYLQFLTPWEAAGRGFAGPVVHILFASIWGHWIGCAHLAGRSIIKCGLEGFAIAAILHGLYDFVVLMNPAWSLPVAALGIGALWIWRLRLMRAMHLTAVDTTLASQAKEPDEPYRQ
jgi:RsiW-degrading membrane proteinase PrsW (M82 family)